MRKVQFSDSFHAHLPSREKGEGFIALFPVDHVPREMNDKGNRETINSSNEHKRQNSVVTE